MARVFTNGFEENTVTANPATWETISGSPTIGSTNVRSGDFAGRISSLSSGAAKGWVKKWLGSTADGPFWGRAYIFVVARPSASNHIMSFNSASGTAGNSDRCKITLESDGTLILREAAGTAVGSPSAVLSLNTWYCVELKYDRTPAGGSEILEARLDHSVFATSSSITFAGGAFAFSVGGNLDLEAQTQGEWWFDDIAINDSADSNQNSYPGSGKVSYFLPNAAGDVNTFGTQTGGTAGAGNNYTRANERPANDATSFNGSNTLNQEDMFNLNSFGVDSASVINVVHLIGRFRNNTADAATAIKFQIKKDTSGTIFQSAAIIPNTTGWNTNGIASPRNFPITLYQDPDASDWTVAEIDTTQIGYKITTGGTNRIDVTQVAMLVDWTPPSGGSSIKTIKGLALASVKTVNGLAIALVKNINGLA